jgi:formate dehydrogenase major subunit
MKVEVDGTQVEVEPGTSVLAAVRLAGRDVPTLCFDERLAPFGACRVCLVGIDGRVAPSCTTLCCDGMAIDTTDVRARRIASNVVELVLSELPEPPAPNTELATVAKQFGVTTSRWRGATHETRHDDRHPYLSLRHELCISCGRCVRACDEIQGAFALTATGRGFEANIAAGLDTGLLESACVSCGACADTCPTGAIAEVIRV